MNVNQLLNMVMRLFLRKAINGGINAGMKRMGGGAGRRGAKVPPGAGQARKGQAGTGQAAPSDNPISAQDQQAIRKARQAARTARRAGRG